MFIYGQMVILLIYTSGEWSTPSVTGEVPPPCAGFTLTKISHTSALLYGGYNPQSGTCIRDCYIMQVTRDGIVSNILKRDDSCYCFICSIGKNWIQISLKDKGKDNFH